MTSAMTSAAAAAALAHECGPRSAALPGPTYEVALLDRIERAADSSTLRAALHTRAAVAEALDGIQATLDCMRRDGIPYSAQIAILASVVREARREVGGRRP